jgi:hypothetical protein
MKRSKKANNKTIGNNVYTTTMPVTPGSPITQHVVQGDVTKFTTTVTTGVIAQSLAIDAGDITSFSRFALYDEFRIIKVVFKAYPCSASTPGSACIWVETKDSSTPTNSKSQTNSVVQFSLGGNNRVIKLSYKPSDFAYNVWTTTATTSFVIGYLNVYTDNATYAAPTTVTDAFVLRAEYTVQFRGFA